MNFSATVCHTYLTNLKENYWIHYAELYKITLLNKVTAEYPRIWFCLNFNSFYSLKVYENHVLS